MGGHFFFAKTFTAGKTKSTPERIEMNITSGIVHDVVIDFPAGCQYLTNVRIIRGAMSVWPRNQGAFYAYEDYQIEIADFWPLLGGENQLVLEGYNIDDTENHTIRVALQVSDPELYFSQLGLLARMDSLIQQQRAILGVPVLTTEVEESG